MYKSSASSNLLLESLDKSLSGLIQSLLTDWPSKYDILNGRIGRHDMTASRMTFEGLAKSSRDQKFGQDILPDAMK